jgi:transposase-like protein
MPHGDIVKTSIPKCIHNINSILVYHNGFQKSSPTKAFIIVHATKETNNLRSVLLQAIALLQEPILHPFQTMESHLVDEQSSCHHHSEFENKFRLGKRKYISNQHKQQFLKHLHFHELCMLSIAFVL